MKAKRTSILFFLISIFYGFLASNQLLYLIQSAEDRHISFRNIDVIDSDVHSDCYMYVPNQGLAFKLDSPESLEDLQEVPSILFYGLGDFEELPNASMYFDRVEPIIEKNRTIFPCLKAQLELIPRLLAPYQLTTIDHPEDEFPLFGMTRLRAYIVPRVLEWVLTPSPHPYAKQIVFKVVDEKTYQRRRLGQYGKVKMMLEGAGRYRPGPTALKIGVERYLRIKDDFPMIEQILSSLHSYLDLDTIKMIGDYVTETECDRDIYAICSAKLSSAIQPKETKEFSALVLVAISLMMIAIVHRLVG